MIVLYRYPFGNQKFVHEWTLFYWGWWLSFLPIMGIFIAKVSKGRTLKQVILGQMVWGSLRMLHIPWNPWRILIISCRKHGIVDLVSILENAGKWKGLYLQ